MVEELISRILGSPCGEILDAVLSGTEAAVRSSRPVVPVLVASLYRLAGGPLLVASPREPEGLASDLECFIPGEVYYLPDPGPRMDGFRPFDDAAGMRMRAARALSLGMVAVCGPGALAQGPPPGSGFWPIEVSVGMRIDLEETLMALVEGGYQREYTVEGWGRFALRGGILDVFPSTADRPVRIELAGDQVETLREFNVVTQRSGAAVRAVEIFPAREINVDYRPGWRREVRIVAVDPAALEEEASRLAGGGLQEELPGELLGGYGHTLRVFTLGGGDETPEFPGGPAPCFYGVRAWEKMIASGTEVFLLLDGQGQVNRARELVAEAGFREPRMAVGHLSRGFEIPAAGLCLFTSIDLLGKRRMPGPPRRASSGTPVASYAELEVGGFVVHVDQGIGIYRGLTTREALGVTREYLLIEYAGGDKLYVPTSQLAKVQRYVGADNPRVHRLRGREWSRAARAARRSAEHTARELLRLYLERKSRKGFRVSPDSAWQLELEESFEHRDTPDQARAVRQVKSDMESDMVMDRLVCGDVGYGKTEVAIRAAMKAVLDSKQVAVLVPTTVLAKQHFDTFSERFAPFPVTVRMLSRFLTRAEQEKVVRGLARGEIDVVIGTHRLLQEDVSFLDLGLLVIDEEQRFGVVHKERLKEISADVDTLTLTATPIPRTLQMSLSGVRDISIIDTPPEDRRPIATYVGEFDFELVQKAVNHEVSRGGQVFFLHNRVQSIGVRRRLPGVSVAVAHGRMNDDELESIMLEFAEGTYDVLVCTTIIESGLDLPNVNTLIIDRADRLGLSQLYQIRGRVGRSGRRAFAYLFYPHRGLLTDQAVARLSTIAEMTTLGSGMRVAMRDLEIRGAGNLLGTEQSGHLEAVGFELYCELLKEAVDVLKGSGPEPLPQATIELPVDAYLPGEYISDEETRVEEYRRLVVMGRSGSIDELELELTDRFGEPPPPVTRLLDLERLRYQAGRAGFESVAVKGRELQLKCAKGSEGVLEQAASYACKEGMGGHHDTYIDRAARTLYLRLRFEDVKKRQELLIKWLKSIIDDILLNGHVGQ